MKANTAWPVWLVLFVAFTFSSLCTAQTQEEEGGGENRQWFSVDSINAGLGEAPEEVSRLTPREAIRSFVKLTEQEEYEAAAHVLNLAEFSEQEQREQGAELARQMAEVLKRGKWLSVSDLPGREDAMIVDASGQNPRAGEVRRSVELATLRTRGDTYAIRLGRYRVGEEEPAWLIMPISVTYIPMLYERFGPSMLENYIPERFQSSFGLLRIWEWIAIPVFLLLNVFFGWVVYRFIGLLATLAPSGGVSIFAGQIGVPTALVVVSLVTQALLGYVVSFSAVATTTFRVVLISILAWGIGTIALRLVDTLMLGMTRRLVGGIDDTDSKDDRKLLTTLYALRRIIILVTVTGVSVYILGQIQLFETLGMSLLASASVLAVLVGVAGQAVLGNILSSFQLSLAKPIRIGDLVIFEEEWCYVEGIFYTFIRLRVWDDRRLIVPVTYFVTRPFDNLSVKGTKMYRSVTLTLHLSADIELIREKFLEVAKEEDDIIEHHKLLCYVTSQTGATQTVTCYLMTSDPMSGWTAEMHVREKLMAFIRDHHPDWWPRDVVVISHRDIARGEGQTQRSINAPNDASSEEVSDTEAPGDRDQSEST
ncbi:mechanosensitive ion channel family protein [Vreelandella arcis]|uniref:Small-conductance mechanosensitive channel n=1 Tax=Vreelandella arcis TaxID=416873 RepID=A0A1H0DF51_9GAMM|nr:mechanosensitive ion channel domain-containing protein [Halomonas arcis]SDN68621.1 Small-conductance mechanosensitive channel [Halomonas arcis]